MTLKARSAAAGFGALALPLLQLPKKPIYRSRHVLFSERS